MRSPIHGTRIATDAGLTAKPSTPSVMGAVVPARPMTRELAVRGPWCRSMA
jgi:hypothetical protein